MREQLLKNEVIAELVRSHILTLVPEVDEYSVALGKKIDVKDMIKIICEYDIGRYWMMPLIDEWIEKGYITYYDFAGGITPEYASAYHCGGWYGIYEGLCEVDEDAVDIFLNRMFDFFIEHENTTEAINVLSVRTSDTFELTTTQKAALSRIATKVCDWLDESERTILDYYGITYSISDE